MSSIVRQFFFVQLLAAPVVGIPILIVGVTWLLLACLFVLIAERADGTVTEVVEFHEGNTMYSPIVEFTDHLGQKRSFQSPVRASPQFWFVGNEVQILYFRDNPNFAAINHWLEIYFVPIVSIPLGIFAILLPTIVSFITRSIRHRSAP